MSSLKTLLSMYVAVLCFFLLVTPSAQALFCADRSGKLAWRTTCKRGERNVTQSGPTGAAGAAGQQGPEGPAGPQGTRGASAFDTIPSGTTVRGYASMMIPTSRTGGGYLGVSLPAPAPQPLGEHDVIIAPTAVCSGCLSAQEVTDSILCTGNVDNPTAPAGKVCIYLSYVGAANEITGTFSGNGPTIYGFDINWLFNTVTEVAGVEATWAYTAP